MKKVEFESQESGVESYLTDITILNSKLKRKEGDFVSPEQCAQIGRFIGLWASF